MEEDIDENMSIEKENGQNFLEMELEALHAIFVNELEVVKNEKLTSVSIDLHPATADKLDEQYVMITLKFTVDDEYPQKIPVIQIQNSRGLSDEKLDSIAQDLKSIAEGKIGNSMLFEVIQAAKEHLTLENLPCGECAICLYSFSESDVFTKTNCYHYFHSHCLARYAKMADKKTDEEESTTAAEDTPSKGLLCPVCRLDIHFEGSEDAFPPPSLRDEELVISEQVLELQKRMKDLFQKQVDKGGIIDIEAEKNKYLLEISNVPTRTTEVVASSDKAEENDLAQSQSPQNKGGRDSKPSSDNLQKNPAASEGKAKNKNYSKQSKNNYNTNRTNPRNESSRQKYDKESFQKEKNFSSPSKSTEGNSEEPCNDPDLVSRSGAKSEATFKKNDRRNNYGPPRRNYEDNYDRNNYYKYPDSRGGNRGRRYPPNGYDRRNFRGNNYRGRGGRPYSEREAPVEHSYQNDTNTTEHSLDSSACDETKLEKYSDSSRAGDKHERNSGDSHKKYSDGNERATRSKPDFQDGGFERGYRGYRQEDRAWDEVERDDYRNYSDRSSKGLYPDRRQYSDARYSEKDSQFQRRGGYAARDNSKRGYYGRGRNRGSFRSSFQRENSEEDAQAKDEEYAREDDERNADFNDRSATNHKRQYSDRPYRGGRGNPRRNGNKYRQNFDERRENYRNGYRDSRNKGSEESAEAVSADRSEGQENENFVEEGSSKRYLRQNSQDYSQDDYHQRGFRDSDRHRQNLDSYRRNQRSSNDRPYKNKSDSYQYNSSRKPYNDQYAERSNSTAKHIRENSELPSGEPVSEKDEVKSSRPPKIPDSLNEKEPSENKPNTSESLCKDGPPVKASSAMPNANFSSNSPKMLQPPPGFSNPLKKVVYGLQAANPPPGFPRS